jgi:hypothetical protein
MSLIDINWKPDKKTLIEFSEFGMFFLGMVASPLAYFRGHPALAMIFWILAVVGRLLGVWRPEWLKPAFIGLTIAAWPIGWVVSNLTLALLYYGVFTPVSLVFRLIGRDPLNRMFDRQAPTYWEPYNPDQGLERYLRQF